jgi:hypothetical protein
VELITLVGEPGIGKSRLVLELFRRVEADPELVRWRQGRCLPYGDGVALWALGEIVKAEAGILESDDADDAEAKLARAVATTIGSGQEATWVESHLRPLVGLGGEATVAGDRRDEAFAAWRRFLEGVAEHGPLVLVFEDLHWADDTLLDFVDHLVDWASDVPMLVVVMARPELLARRPGWGGGKPNSMTHSLPQLTDEETASLVHTLLGRTVMPADTQRTLVANAGGNPLYAEEFARMLGERGATTEGLPESVQGIIAARLDALEPRDKALLMDAAVLGKVFWLGALSGVVGEPPEELERRLHELERRELIRRDRASAVAGERQYAFRHALVRDVAYAQIPRAARAEKHAAAATWIEALASDRSEDRAEMLAHHWSEAIRYAEAAGRSSDDFADPARRALADAGDRALSLNAVAAAAALYAQALALAGADPPASLLLQHARSLYLAGDERAADALELARDALATAGDLVGEAFAEAMLSYVVWLGGDTDAATRHVERAVGLVEGSPPSEMKAHVLARAASRAQVAGRDDEAVVLAREAADIAATVGVGDVEIHALTTLGSARLALQDIGGLADLERAFELALARSSPEGARTALNLGVSHFLLGDIARYRDLHAEGLRIGERFGMRPIVRFAQGTLTSISYFVGEWDRAMAEADAFIAECARSPHYQEVHARAIRAAIRFARDDVPGALADVEAALHGASDPQSRAPVLAVASRIFGELDDPRAVDTALEVLDIDPGTTSEPLSSAFLALSDVPRPVADRLREVVAVERAGASRWMEAARLALAGRFTEAAETYASMPFMAGEAESRVRAAEALFDAGRPAEAEVQLTAAIALWRRVGATRYLARAEALRDRTVA